MIGFADEGRLYCGSACGGCSYRGTSFSNGWGLLYEYKTEVNPFIGHFVKCVEQNRVTSHQQQPPFHHCCKCDSLQPTFFWAADTVYGRCFSIHTFYKILLYNE